MYHPSRLAKVWVGEIRVAAIAAAPTTEAAIQGRVINIHDAKLKTVSVGIKARTISDRQVTLAVFSTKRCGLPHSPARKQFSGPVGEVHDGAPSRFDPTAFLCVETFHESQGQAGESRPLWP
jgi:hypothetical protein